MTQIRTILIIIAVAAISALAFMTRAWIQERNARKVAEFNLVSYGTENEQLVLTSAQLKYELYKRGGTIDSLLKARKINPKDVVSIEEHTTTIQNHDTVYLANFDTIHVRDSIGTKLYKTLIQDDRNCIRIQGFVLSTDEFPSVAITQQDATIDTYDIVVHRKWWQFLWKPKTWTETYTKCGDLKVLRIDKN